MKTAICLLTCNRVQYTRRTLETLTSLNDLSEFVLLHGDDGSDSEENSFLAKVAGFETVVQTERGKRQGVARMTELLFKAASDAGCDAVLNLQNDWECRREIPVKDIEAIFSDPMVYCLRLYGFWKSDTGRAGQHHGGRNPRVLVEWKPYRIDGYEVGEIHWGHPPAVTRILEAIDLTQDAIRESVSRVRSGGYKWLTVRVIENVFSHIGRERTPWFHA